MTRAMGAGSGGVRRDVDFDLNAFAPTQGLDDVDECAAGSKAIDAMASVVPSSAGVWFESSWDLHAGLTVREGLPTDPDLDEWLAAELL